MKVLQQHIEPSNCHEIHMLVVQRLQRLAWLIDHGRADETPEFFTVDASIDGAVPTLTGRVSIQAAMTRRAGMTEVTSCHVQTNFHAEWAHPEELVMHHILTLFRSESDVKSPEPKAVLQVTDRIVLDQDGAWRIAHRHQRRVFGLK